MAKANTKLPLLDEQGNPITLVGYPIFVTDSDYFPKGVIEFRSMTPEDAREVLAAILKAWKHDDHP